MPVESQPNAFADGEAPHRWRSSLLGEPREVALAAGTLQYFERGHGPVVVLAHGWLANANLWRKVVDELAVEHRCLTLDLPFGSHRVPMRPDADLTPTGCGALIAEALDALDLSEVTLVGNDSGGAYSQIATALAPTRIARLALNSCETPYDEFPPPPFDGLPAAAADPGTLRSLFEALRDRDIRASEAAYGLLIKHPIEKLVSDSYALPCLEEDGVLHDTCKVMSSARSAPVHEAAARLIAVFERPVLFAWGADDRVFPIANARRYASELSQGQLAPIEDAYSFTPEDQPASLAHVLARFAGGGHASD